MKTTIAIIGATGSMGSALAKSLAKDNRLLLMSKSDKIHELVGNLLDQGADVEYSACSKDCSWEADIIIMAVPYQAEKEIALAIKEVVTQKIVISISNPINETLDGQLTQPGFSSAEELQALMPHSKIVKAFNTTFALDFARPVIDGNRVDCFVAGDNSDAVAEVEKLVRSVGFNAVNAGKLIQSRTLEAMQMMLITIGLRDNYNWYGGFKVLHS